MSRTSKALKRLGVAGIAVATIGAGVPALVATSASAAPGGATTQLVISPTSQTGSAGTCILYTVSPLNGTSEAPGDTPTITVQVTENPLSDTQDVDFCTVPDTGTTARGTSPVVGAGATYFNGNSAPSRQFYAPGTTNSSPAPAAGGGNDSASGASGQATATNTNPTGVDSARYTGTNDGATATTIRPNNGSIVFGIAGAVAGGANITAFIDDGTGGVEATWSRQASEIKTNTDATATFTGGGTAEAVNTVDAEPETGSAPINTVITYTVTLTNSSGQTVSSVTPVASVTAGPDAAQPAGPGGTPAAQAAQPVACNATDNSGKTTCSYTTRNVTGSDTILTWVNKTCGLSSAFDSCEPSDEITRTVAPATSAARFIAITPRDVTTSSGTTRVFSATVTDVHGTAVPDVEVTFFENGPGRFVTPDAPGCDCLTTATGANGVATATVTSASAETGTEEVSAFITGVGTRDATGKFTRTGGSNSASTQCGQAKGAGAGATATTPAGNCSDTTTNTFVIGASPTATPTSTASPTPSTACTAAQQNLPVRVNTPIINATGLASVTVTGAPSNGRIELQGYSQNHYGTANFNNDPTPIDRSVTAGSDGSATISDLRPASNTRLRARVGGCPFAANALGSVINVRTQLTLQVVRTGTRKYTISGHSIPARPGGLIVNIYCDRCTSPGPLIAQPRADQTTGEYKYSITFPAGLANSRVNLQARTGQDAQNAPGSSNIRNLLVY